MCVISVIIPVYNVEKYIRRCLESLCNQTFKDFEVILINDGSKQNEDLIINEYLPYNHNFRYYKKENGGQATARNRGIEQARGEYIFFLDSDDYLETNALQDLYVATENKKNDIVWCDAYFVYENGTREYFKTNGLYTQDMRKNCLINASAPWGKLIRRGIFDFDGTRFLEGRIYEDLASVGTYLLYANRIVYVEKPLYNYAVRMGSTMNQVKYNKKMEDIFFAIHNLRDVFEKKQEYQNFVQEFEFIYIMRLLHDASLRFFEFPEGRECNNMIADIMTKEYPSWRKNKYYQKEKLKYKIICELFARKQYKILEVILKKGC